MTNDRAKIWRWMDVDIGGLCYPASSTPGRVCIARRRLTMCKRSITDTQGMTARDSYTGVTRRLDDHTPLGTLRSAAGRGAFPWWTLWFLWPLTGVLKVAVPVVWSGVVALSQVTVPLLPVVVIVGVLVVLWRR